MIRVDRAERAARLQPDRSFVGGRGDRRPRAEAPRRRLQPQRGCLGDAQSRVPEANRLRPARRARPAANTGCCGIAFHPKVTALVGRPRKVRFFGLRRPTGAPTPTLHATREPTAGARVRGVCAPSPRSCPFVRRRRRAAALQPGQCDHLSVVRRQPVECLFESFDLLVYFRASTRVERRPVDAEQCVIGARRRGLDVLPVDVAHVRRWNRSCSRTLFRLEVNSQPRNPASSANSSRLPCSSRARQTDWTTSEPDSRRRNAGLIRERT